MDFDRQNSPNFKLLSYMEYLLDSHTIFTNYRRDKDVHHDIIYIVIKSELWAGKINEIRSITPRLLFTLNKLNNLFGNCHFIYDSYRV